MNSVSLIGNLVRDPELSYTPSQTALCKFTIAVNRPRRQGENQGADYLRVVVWGAQGENCDRYLSKGKKVGVHGRIQTGSYKDRNGQTVYTTDIVADNVDYLSPQGENSASGERYGNNGTSYQPQQNSMPQGQNFGSQQSFDDIPDSFAAAEEDCPF